MIPAQNELLRLNILFQLYNDLFKVENYADIQKQFYKIIGCNKSQILAAIYYLDSRGSIEARSTRDKDVIQMYIRARGIDDIEDRISKGILLVSSNQIIPIILIKWPEEDKNYNNDDNKSGNSSKDSKKDKSDKNDKKGKDDKKDNKDKKDKDDKK
ncbi:hypothetical protein JOC70_002735 [Clostridium pascui]|uniref:hypothetical protein n=1 Tax=Clostridium pascui TaxID=46609 RepID=UPI0019562EE2|nr:hypothetical protein [Clostridium pascui]MBM7871237.1 hypothetical protein [Clostridium pascui]